MHHEALSLSRAVKSAIAGFPVVTTEQAAKIREQFAIIKDRNAQ